MLTEDFRSDFRNEHPDRVRKLFTDAGLSSHRVQNFKRTFRTKSVSDLRDLKGAGDLSPLVPLLPFRTLDQIVRHEDRRGNQKFVFRTGDGLNIESVLMPKRDGFSICISVQAGCRFGCRFCRTGSGGLKRSLMPWEMLEQVRQIYQGAVHPAPITCITFMGMGEPFDNLDSCRTAFEWMRTDWGWSVGAKKITFSTIGELNWDAFFGFETLPNLAVSLHSANRRKRRSLMPGARQSLELLREHMLRYASLTNKQVSVEYCLFAGINDARADAVALADYLGGVPCKVNLLNYNPVEMKGFQPVSRDRLLGFMSWLKDAGLPVIHRKSLGVEIGAGCGQLG
jgi:23S rRNA (adenine2503-C2)-methyltransferase